MNHIKRKLLLIFSMICMLFVAGFDKTAESEITFTIYSMTMAMNKKDSQGYIQTLSDFFIKENYGDEKYITEKINEFGQVIEIDFQIKEIKSYTAVVQYKLLHINANREKSTFYGEMILIKTKDGWKIHFVEEKMIS
ncbi:hypothetical protein [Neobacillus vireti]|uniref:hypothetical protein n=1 Tax=Neobacillus vireti TaxID=220686 RepID=UPI002FFF1460